MILNLYEFNKIYDLLNLFIKYWIGSLGILFTLAFFGILEFSVEYECIELLLIKFTRGVSLGKGYMVWYEPTGLGYGVFVRV